jgi:predicted KAP-like P-loop ATPase
MKKSPEKTDSPKYHHPEQSRNDNEFYSADSPIINPELDEFNRKYFSERIARTIANRKDSKSLVIGVYGKWGEGKTTVLNFIDSELKRHDNVATLFFNPWMFPSETELFIAFYTELAKGIEISLSTGKEK